MKLAAQKSWRSRSRGRGFTLAELMIASATLVLVFGAIIAVNLWGLAMTQRSEIWLFASDDARHTMGLLHEDVRTANIIYVGSGNMGGFTNAASTNVQAGNALKLYASTNTNSWVLYYYDPVACTLYRTNWDGTSVGDYRIVSANPITNDNNIFTMQDYLGNVLQSNTTTPYSLIAVYLSFTKLQNPQIIIQPGSPVDFYQLNLKIAPRMRP
jgi:Tfp pilus assembly protein PilW